MAIMTIREITAAETRFLRHLVLRPNQHPDELVFAGDDTAGAAHFGAFIGDDLIGIVSITPESAPIPVPEPSWRGRGMAVLPEQRNSGVGTMLLEALLNHVRSNGGACVWCTARTTATKFYLRHEFRVVGDVFEVQDAGPHVYMWRGV